MEDLIAGMPKFFATFNLGNFLASIQWVFFLVYILLSGYFASKTYKDAQKRYDDNIIIILMTLIVFALNILGYWIYTMIRPRDFIQEQQMSKLEKYFLEYETRGIGKCRVCKYIYFPEYTYCVNCGSIVRTRCSLCSNIIELEWKVCPYCGDKKRIEMERSHLAISATETNFKSIDTNSQ